MTSTDRIDQSDVNWFSGSPFAHYFLAISVAGFAETLHFALATYQCLGNTRATECGWTATNSIARSGVGSDALVTFGLTLGFSAFEGLLLIIYFLPLISPAYALAWYVSCRLKLKRDIFGFAFWIGVWVFAFFGLAVAGRLVNPRYLTWASTEHIELKFAVLGLLGGIAYCAFAGLDGRKAAAS